MKKFAVLTNDLQYAAANKHEERKKSVEVFLPHETHFLNEMRKLGLPIIHLQLINPDNDPRAVGQPDELRFTRGSKGSQILSEVLSDSDIVMEKPKDSGFFETKLHEELQKMGIDTLIITGMQTQICIQTTAADAHFRNYGVYVPSDCCASTRPEDTKRSLEWMADYCAKVMTSEEIIEVVKKELNETK